MRELAAALALVPVVAAAERPELPFAEAYKKFLAAAVTSRLAVSAALQEARAKGFRLVDAFADPPAGERLQPGDRVAIVNRDRTLLLAIVGKRGPSEGIRLVGTHVDAPHLRLLQRALGRVGPTLTLRASATGGLKPYHWEGRPLALRGVVHASHGRVVEIDLGAQDDFTFIVAPTDAGPGPRATVPRGAHPGRPARGATFEVLAATVPARPPGRGDPLKLSFLRFLGKRYGIVETDLRSAELALVPADPPRDVGLDRRLVAAYGQDDRLCSFAALRAILEVRGAPPRTVAAYLVDREEVGSTGATSARSEFLSLALQRLLRATGARHDENAVRAAWARTEALSADAGSGVNPLFPGVHDLGNAARLGHGPMIKKHTGRRGKRGGHDAHAEFVARVVRIFDAASVPWQVGTAGRVDEGGGGTISNFLARLGAAVLDLGVPVLSMHAPYEIASKRDAYLLYRALGAFFRAP